MRNDFLPPGGNGVVDYTARPAQVIDHTPPASPSRSEGALGPYLRAIRAHRLAFGLIVLAALLGALFYLAVRSPDYQATAEILITPIPQDDETFTGIQVAGRDSPGDPTRTVQTAASLVDTPEAAALAAQRIGNTTGDDVDAAVDVEPKGQSNILTITGKAGSGAEAAKLANEYAKASLDARSTVLKGQIAASLTRLRARLQAVSKDDPVTRADITSKIGQLEAIQDGRDPSLSLLQTAEVPTSPSGPASWLVVALALLAGVVLATGAALLLEMLDRSVRDQDELLELYPLPVLTRVPKLTRRQRAEIDASPMALPPAAREAFRTLRVQLEQDEGSHRRIMVTSGSSQDGKTTSAVNLALALMGAGHRVILIDFDLRKPGVASALGITGEKGLVSLVAPDSSIEDVLIQAPNLPGSLRVLPAGGDGDIILLEALTKRLPALLKEAEQLADYVVIDTAPLGEVSDALRVVDVVDDVIITARPGNTNRDHFLNMRDLLHRTGIKPLGYLVVGVSSSGTSSYSTYGFTGRRGATGNGRRPTGTPTGS